MTLYKIMEFIVFECEYSNEIIIIIIINGKLYYI